MDFELDPAQQVVADLTAQLLAAHADEPAAAWKAMADAGLLALALPERLGGDGLDAIATMVMLTETGRRTAGVPTLPTLALGVLPLIRWGGPGADETVRRAAAGDLRLTSALREPAGRPTVLGPGGSVTGVKTGVLDADVADLMLVTADGTLLLVDPAAGGVRVRRTPSAGGLAEHTVTLDDAPATVLGGADAADDLHRIALAAAVASA
ncbi:MAG: acyl-CoA dehydrogenase, partial [Hamadaea sp.]|nr:acyl-CoA dehydrogenase [Hamadaea sp.]